MYKLFVLCALPLVTSCVAETTPCGTRAAFATTVSQGTFECTTWKGDTVKGGVAGSAAEVTAISQGLLQAFQLGARAAGVP